MASVWRCGRCGLRRLRPRPGPEALSRYYAEASGYNAFIGRKRSERSQRIWDFLRDCRSRPAGWKGWRRWISPLGSAIANWAFDINVPLNGRTGLRVIEVGSGYGDILIYLKSRGCQVMGSDLSVEAARKGAEYGVDIRVGNLVDLRLPTSSFDVAILSHSLEHLPDPNVELTELARLLKPGGRIHIAVPNGSAVRLKLDGRNWDHLSHPFHLWYFDPRTLVRILTRHGFVPIRSPVTTTRHHAVTAWKRIARRKGWWVATRGLMAFLKASIQVRDGGDVVRVVAELRGKPVVDPLAARLDPDEDGTKVPVTTCP